MHNSALRRNPRLKRLPHLSISPRGQVFVDGELIGHVGSVHTVWGETLWGFKVAGVNMDLYYVKGDRWVAARSCAVAHIKRRNDRTRQLRLQRSA